MESWFTYIVKDFRLDHIEEGKLFEDGAILLSCSQRVRTNTMTATTHTHTHTHSYIL